MFQAAEIYSPPASKDTLTETNRCYQRSNRRRGLRIASKFRKKKLDFVYDYTISVKVDWDVEVHWDRIEYQTPVQF